MRIDRLTRMDTTIIPEKFLSVVKVSAVDGPEASPEEVAEILAKDRDGIDGIVFESVDTDIFSIEGVHHIVKNVRPEGVDCIAMTDGSNPDGLDDLVGAGWFKNVIFSFSGPLTEDQEESLLMAEANGCRYHVQVVLKKGEIDEASLTHLASKCEECGSFTMRNHETKGFDKKELASLAACVKDLVRNARLV